MTDSGHTPDETGRRPGEQEAATTSGYVEGVCDGLNQAAAWVQGWGLGSDRISDKRIALYLVWQLQGQAIELRKAQRLTQEAS